MGVKMGWIQIKMGHPLAQNKAALAHFVLTEHTLVTEVCRLVVTNLRRKSAHALTFGGDFELKFRACANFLAKFVTTNLQTSVQFYKCTCTARA